MVSWISLSYLAKQVKSLTLFVTHYLPLCELEKTFPSHVGNYHMAFLLNEPDEHDDRKTFIQVV